MNFKIKRLTRKYCKMIFLLICLLQLTFINFAFAEEASTDETNSKGFLAISAGLDSQLFDIYKIHLMNDEFGIEFGAGGFIYDGISDDANNEVYNDTGVDNNPKVNIYILGLIKRFNLGYMGLGYSWLNWNTKNSGATGELKCSSVDFFGGMTGRADSFFYDFRVGYRYGVNGKYTLDSDIDSLDYEIDDINILEGPFVTISMGFAF